MNLKLANRQLFRAGASSVINALGAQLFSYTLGYYLLVRTGSALSFGLSIFIGPMVSLVTAPGIARLIDNWSHKKTSILGTLLTIASLLGFECYLILTNGQAGLLIAAVIVSVLMNVSSRLFSLAYLASIQGIVPLKLVQRLNAVQSVGNSTAGILAPPLAGLLFGLLSLKVIILIQVLTEVVTLLLTYRTKFDAFKVETTDTEEPDENVSTFAAAWKYLRHEPQILMLIISASLLNVIYVAFQIGGPYVIMHYLHRSATVSGMVESFTSVGLILGGAIITIVTLKNIFKFALGIYLLYGGAIIISGILLQIPILPLLIIFAVTNFILGLLNALGDPPLFAYFQVTAPYKLLGHLTTIMLTLTQILNPIGVLIYTTLFDHVSYQSIFLGNVVILLLLVICICWWQHKAQVKHLSSVDSDTHKE